MNNKNNEHLKLRFSHDTQKQSMNRNEGNDDVKCRAIIIFLILYYLP